MNYPDKYNLYAYPGNDNELFFRRFKYRFTDEEMLFLRHAPESFVQMGGETYGENHAIEATAPVSPTFELELRTGRKNDEFQFMEPVVVELKLKSCSKQKQLVPDDLLKDPDNLTLVIRKRYGKPMLLAPYFSCLREPEQKVLKPGQSIFDSLFISAGAYGWMIDEPGWYEISACLHFEHRHIHSSPLWIRIAPPRTWDEEYLAQDFFSNDISRTLTFDGTRVLTKANDVLKTVVERLADRNVAIHANVALQMPQLESFKEVQRAGHSLVVSRSDPQESAIDQLAETLAPEKDPNWAAEVLGNIDYNHYMRRLAFAARHSGREDDAAQLLESLGQTLKARRVNTNVRRRVRRLLNKFKNEDEL
jgi:hypothetical protein